MAKKKTVIHVNKVTPKVSFCDGVNFTSLMQGDGFLMNGDLFIKTGYKGDVSDQFATNLATGHTEEDICGTNVIPVDISVTWKKK